MSNGRTGAAGKTRTCPHCKATILDSAAICPACQHYLRFDAGAAGQSAQPSFSALSVEGRLRHPATEESWEYSVVVSIRNAAGEELARHVVGVGALQAGDERTFALSVEIFKPSGRPGGR